MAKDPFLHTLFNEMPCACIYHELICDESGNAVDYVPLEANPGFQRTIGVDPAPIIGKRATEYLPEMDAKHWLSIFAPAALLGRTVTYHMLSPQMKQTYYGTAISPEKGYFLSMFTIVGNTPIPARESETMSVKQHERLSPHDFAQKIFETMPCAAATHKIDCDETGTPVDYTIVDVNPAFCEMMNTTPQAMIGKNASGRMSRAEFEHWLGIFATVAFGGKPAHETVYFPHKKYTCDGVAISQKTGSVMVIFMHRDASGKGLIKSQDE